MILSVCIYSLPIHRNSTALFSSSSSALHRTNLLHARLFRHTPALAVHTQSALKSQAQLFWPCNHGFTAAVILEVSSRFSSVAASGSRRMWMPTEPPPPPEVSRNRSAEALPLRSQLLGQYFSLIGLITTCNELFQQNVTFCINADDTYTHVYP